MPLVGNLPENFFDLPRHIKDGILDQIINPSIFLPQWWVWWHCPVIGYFVNDVANSSWSSYVVLPYVEPEADYDY